jgi:diaminohydroxyphosphoribosylaminopyrimidine deaminase/5-amino-6-(5-phosphoribosylamino)uracil reductase
MVGCVIVSATGETVGWGYHRHFGGPHAEIVALQRAGTKAKGATMYCTLEPCNHLGKTGPCSQAIIDAGIARVLVARRDPWPQAAGGIEHLCGAGVDAQVVEGCDFAIAVSDPFAYRLATGLPWVTVKWAQTVDGRIATSAGESKWISNETSRRMVHRERGRVDAIITGIGTVLADDPLLTPRGPGARLRRAQVRQPHGRPVRVIIDQRLQTPLSAKVVTTIDQAPTIVACAQTVFDAAGPLADPLRSRGVSFIPLRDKRGEMPLKPLMQELATRHNVTHVLVEAGTGLMSQLFAQRLVNEAWVFTAPLLLGDDKAAPPLSGMTAQQLTDGVKMQLWSLRRRGGDVIARYRVSIA